jgi:hypothetical protein
MSDQTTSLAADFSIARKGYAVAQVQQALLRFTVARDEAWQRLADLSEEVRTLELGLEELARARKEAEVIIPDFEVLSPRAAGLLVTAQEEAKAVRAAALVDANRIDGESRVEARRLRAEAEQYAEKVHAVSEEVHLRELDRARSVASAERKEAQQDGRALREEAAAQADEIRVRAETAAREAQAWLAGQQRTAAQEFAAHDVKVTAWEGEVAAVGERKLEESERYYQAMEVRAAEIDDEAAAEADRRLEAAQREAERIAEHTAREQAAFAERRERIQSQLDHIRETLAALTGSVAGGEQADVASEADASELSVRPQAVDKNEE